MGKKTRAPTLSKKDKVYLEHCLKDHMSLLEAGHGVLWERTLKEEQDHIDRVVRAAKKNERNEFSGKDYLFVEFALMERCDFIEEGFGQRYKDHEAGSTFHLLNKLKRVFGLNKCLANEHLCIGDV